MLAACMEKMRSDGCGGCERRDACAELFPRLFGAMFAARPEQAQARASARSEKAGPAADNPFLAFLGQVARAMEDKARDGRSPASAAGSRPGRFPSPATPAQPTASPFRARVEQCLEPLLPSGEVGIERVARALGCSRQTLYRRLKAEGVTFEQVLDALRHRLALRYIQGERMGVKQAAYRLGFSDPAAFSRAFKRWTGRSPGAMPH